MDMPITRASAYFKRNRTTHSWCEDWAFPNELMARSCPGGGGGRTLEDHMRRERARAARPSMTTSFYQPRGSSHTTDSAAAVPVVIRAKTQARGRSIRE